MNCFLPNRWRAASAAGLPQALQLLPSHTLPRLLSSWKQKKTQVAARTLRSARSQAGAQGGEWPHKHSHQRRENARPAWQSNRQGSPDQLADVGERLSSLPDRERIDSWPSERRQGRGDEASSSGRSTREGRYPSKGSFAQPRESFRTGQGRESQGARARPPGPDGQAGGRDKPARRQAGPPPTSQHTAPRAPGSWKEQQQRRAEPWQRDTGTGPGAYGSRSDRRAHDSRDFPKPGPEFHRRADDQQSYSRSSSYNSTDRNRRDYDSSNGRTYGHRSSDEAQGSRDNRSGRAYGSNNRSGPRPGGRYEDSQMPSYEDYSSPRAGQERGAAPIYGAYDSSDDQGYNGRVPYQSRELSLQHRLQGEALYGVSPVAAAIAAGRRKLYTLYIQEGLKAGKRNDAGACKAAIAAAEALGVNIEEVPKHELNLACDNRPHQGLVLDCEALQMEALNKLPAPDLAGGPPYPVWLVLDEIYDPQNLGAVLRSAHFLGATGVVCCAKNSAPLSPVVAKASAGALDAMTVYCCSSMPRTLNAAAEDGWRVLGADISQGATECAKYTLSGPTLLVLGSEGSGLRPLVRNACTELIQIGPPVPPKSVAVSNVDSLNVSVAAGVLLHHLVHAQNAPQAENGIMRNGIDREPELDLAAMASEQLGAIA